MRRILHFATIALFIASLSYSSTDSIPPFRVSDCLGVNIHFVEPQEKQLDTIAEAGFGMIRMDFGWERSERQKGIYDFSGYKRLTEALQKRNITPLYILDYSNKLYEKERSVVTDEGRKAFARFSAEAVKNISGGPILWEIWNEPNIKQFWGKPNPAQYVLLVEKTVKAMRSVDPNCTILAPATSQIDMKFLEGCFDRGLLRWIDAVSVHPYRTKPPETAMEEYANLRSLMDRYTNGKNKPILSGEWGYSVHKYGNLNVDERMQAQFLVRQFLTNFMSDVRVSIWYDWHDDGPDPKEREHNFGTVKRDFSPKESYKAAKVFNTELKGLEFLRAKKNEGTYWAEFGTIKKTKVIVGWTTGESHHESLQSSKVNPEAVTLLGDALRLERRNGKWIVPISQDPIYIHLKN